VIIVSPGLDLAAPDNFRALKWTVPPEEVVATVKKAGALPTLQGPVTFVLVPTAGPQPQLGQAQKNYLKAVWTALLEASGATSVTFIDAGGTAASSAAPSAPTVPVPWVVRAGRAGAEGRDVHRARCCFPGGFGAGGDQELAGDHGGQPGGMVKARPPG
jgi:hypothetical protein